MRLSEKFYLREVAEQYMLLPSGDGLTDCNEVAFLSKSAAYLWKALQGKEFCEDEAASLIIDEYEVDPATARADIAAIIKIWREKNMLYD